MPEAVAVVLSHSTDGIVRGTGTLVSLSDEKEQKSMMSAKSASYFSFHKGVSSQKYPSSLMGSIALLKQLFLDSYWYENTQKTTNISFNEFNNQLGLTHIFKSSLATSYNRIYKISDEFEIDFIVKGNGKEYEIIDEIKTYNFPIILPLNFPLKYEINNPEESNILTLSKLKHWETAPFNARILSENNIDFCFTIFDLKKKSDFLKNIRISIEKGLNKYDALNALTIVPATLIGEEGRLGTLEKGKKANFIICSSDIFEDGIIYENWTNGIQNIIEEKTEIDLRGNYTFKSGNEEKHISISGEMTKIKMEEIISDSTSIIYDVTQNGNTIVFHTKATLVDGSTPNVELKKVVDTTKKPKPEKKKKKELPFPVIVPVSYPNGAYGFSKLPEAETLLFKNATVWTNESEGILEATDVLVQNGLISKIGKNLKS